MIAYLTEHVTATCAELCEQTAAAPVQVIGSRFVLYRPSHKKDKKDKIILVKK